MMGMHTLLSDLQSCELCITCCVTGASVSPLTQNVIFDLYWDVLSLSHEHQPSYSHVIVKQVSFLGCGGAVLDGLGMDFV